MIIIEYYCKYIKFIQAKAADIKKFCNEHLANFKVPKSIEFVEVLPKTATGKVLKTELRKANN
ncbi:MAG: AMP-binding enzyme [Eubacteriales bacterium]